MDENLITKKELLELTGISYGALYRWKRMKLLPDEWFIHRSTFTGHETFFPRDKVLGRVEEIQRLKEEMSLEEIARHFSPNVSGEISITAAEAVEKGIALIDAGHFGVEKMFIFSELLREGQLTRDEALEMAETALAAEDISEPVVYLLRKYGVAFCLTAGEMQKIAFDRQSTLAAQVAVSARKAALTELLRQKGVSI